MLKKMSAFAAMALLVSACATTPEKKQSNAAQADQLFGKAKVVYVGVSGIVAVYNVGCLAKFVPAPICTNEIKTIVNDTQRAAADAIEAAEAVFADVNSTADARIAIANATMTIVNRLQAAIEKYGLARETLNQ